MASHEFEILIRIHFDDGTFYDLDDEFTGEVYYYSQQKFEYWVIWVEQFLKEHPEITAKPVRVEEVYALKECEEYQIYIGM